MRNNVFARWLPNGRPRASGGHSERRKASTDDAYIQFDAAIADNSLMGASPFICMTAGILSKLVIVTLH